MKLKIRRSQNSGMMGKVTFILDVRAELTSEEAELVRKYQLGKNLVYSSEQADRNTAAAQAGNIGALGSMFLDRMLKRSFTVNDLVNGQHIECKDLAETIATEEQVRTACGALKQYLAAAALFNGEEEVVTVAA